jgi:hypothetical protein
LLIYQGGKNLEAAFTQKPPCAINGATAVRNQRLIKIVIEGFKCLAKKRMAFSSEQDRARTNQIHQIAFAYYFNQLP